MVRKAAEQSGNDPMGYGTRYTVGRDPGTGRQVQRSIYGATQKEVRQKLAAITAELDRGIYQAPNKITVATWMNEWLETFCESKVKQLTYESYAAIIKNHISPAIGAIELQALKGTHIQRMYNGLIKTNFSGKTVKNISAVLHKSLDVAVKQKIILSNPCDAAELPKVTRKEIRPLSDEDIPRFLAAIKDSSMGNAYALCLFAGLRKGECLGLSWEQIDFERGRITISQQLQTSKAAGGYYIAKSTKSGKVRTIEPPSIAFQFLKAEQKRQIENRFAAGPVWSNPDNLVFTDETGKHYAYATFYKNFKKIAAAIGRPDARPHDLRHTAATVALAAGADVKSVQSLLGHATASFTLDVYAHTTEQMMKDTANRVQRYYNSLYQNA